MVIAIVLNGPHKDKELKICPHCQYYDILTDDGKLIEYKVANTNGMYYLVYQRIRCEQQRQS